MQSKIWVFLALLFPLVAFIYFSFSQSYQLSLESRYYYFTGNYDRAYALAKEAFELDGYNRMASSVMAQSRVAVKFVKYINQSQRYLAKIDEIVAKEELEYADKIRIKMMSEIMMELYPQIQATVLTDDGLVEEVKKHYEQFVNLHEKVTQSL